MDRVSRILFAIAVLLGAFSLTVLAVRIPGLLAVIVVLRVVLRRRSYPTSDVFGDARWCAEDDARRAGLL